MNCPARLVLLADDDPDRGLLLDEALGMAALPARVEQVTGGRDALRYLRHEPPFEDRPRPDVVMLDLHMPDLDGFGVLEDLQRRPVDNQPPVIAVTASPSLAERQRMRDLGCVAVLSKRLPLRDFSAAVARAAGPWLGP